MTAPQFVLVANEAIEHLGAKAGDSILIRPDHPEPIVVLHRPGASLSHVATLVDRGLATPPNEECSKGLSALLKAGRPNLRVLR